MSNQLDALELKAVKETFLPYCKFSLGKKYIEQQQPVFDYLWIKRELQRTKEAFQLYISYGEMPFYGVKDISSSLSSSLKHKTLTPMELKQVEEHIHGVIQIQKYFKQSEMKSENIEELVDAMHAPVDVMKAIASCIHVSGEVKDHASGALAGIRKSLSETNKDLQNEVQRFVKANASKMMDTITVLRNERVCVLMKTSEKNSVSGFIHGDSLSGQASYVEPQSFVILNNKLSGLKMKEQDEINRILDELTSKVRKVAYALQANLDTMAILDALFAKAAWMKNFNGCISNVEPLSKQFVLKDARHPLIDSKSVVANTYQLRKPYRCIMISGSNTGGKTVTLKTIGLCMMMTYCGFPVCCESATIPMYDGIFVDIGDNQSIEQSLSTFSAHMSNISQFLNKITKDSFVILDELGAGTDPKEGESLAVAIIERVLSENATLLVTTHYSKLKEYASTKDDILLASVAFDLENLLPTYKYVEGVGAKSYALEIAEKLGLPESVVSRAKDWKNDSKTASEVALEKLEEQHAYVREYKEKLKQELDHARILEENRKKEYEKRKNEIELLYEKAKNEANILIEEANHKANEVIEELKQLQSDVKPHEILLVKEKLKNIVPEEENLEVEEEFNVGDYVELKDYHYFGEILSIKGNKACVLTNGMKMNTTLAKCKHAQKANKPKKKEKGSVSHSRIKSMSMEVNVIGMRVDEALPVIDKYLDDALFAKIYQVRIVHGNGTGALRQGIHKYLKRHVSVENFRLGVQGEGGMGATVVTLKKEVSNYGKHGKNTG